MQVPASVLDSEARAALHGITTSGVITADGGSLPATVAEEDPAVRPTTYIDFEA